MSTATDTKAEAPAESDDVHMVDCPDCEGQGVLGSQGEKLITCERCGGHEDAPGTGKISITDVGDEEATAVPEDDAGDGNVEPCVVDPEAALKLNCEIGRANDELKAAQAMVEDKKLELKRANKGVDLALRRLQTIIDSRHQPELPFPEPDDGESDEAPVVLDEDVWRDDAIEVLAQHGLRLGVIQKLREQDITTLGEAQDWLNPPNYVGPPEKRARQWTDVPGVGDAGAKKIEDAWESYMEARAKALPAKEGDESAASGINAPATRELLEAAGDAVRNKPIGELSLNGKLIAELEADGVHTIGALIDWALGKTNPVALHDLKPPVRAAIEFELSGYLKAAGIGADDDAGHDQS